MASGDLDVVLEVTDIRDLNTTNYMKQVLCIFPIHLLLLIYGLMYANPQILRERFALVNVLLLLQCCFVLLFKRPF